MIKGTDKLSSFPEEFNKLETEVKQLAENTKGIRNATWITAVSTAVLALVAVAALFVPYFV